MASRNKILIIGYLGKDPELRYTPNGNPVCNLSMATTEKRKDRYGEQEEVTTWFRITVWGKQAELCNEYLRKGSQAYIEGRLSMETWTDREGGNRASLVVNATDIMFLSKSDRGDAEGGDRDDDPPPQRSQSQSHSRGRSNATASSSLRGRESDPPEDLDSEIPF